MKTSLLQILVFLALAGCMTAQNHSALDALQGMAGGAPYVEAYIEYPGPSEKWAGPASFILHVEAKDASTPSVRLTPNWFNTPTGEKHPPLQITKETAREQIANLAAAILNAPEIPYKGCVSPIRVRLIRQDGNVLEKMACRTERGWPNYASQTVHFFMSAFILGAPPALAMPAKPEPIVSPASVVSPKASPQPQVSPSPVASSSPKAQFH